MKKNFLITLITLLLISALIIIKAPVKADSGFDSSYGGGSSSWSGSSWDSGSSYTYSSYRSGSYDENDGLMDICMAMYFIGGIYCIGIFFCAIINARLNDNRTPLVLDHSKEIDDDEVRKYIKDFDRISFLRDRFSDYLKVQEDWMNFNYDELRKNLTDELYNQYEMQLQTLEAKNQKNIMKNFTYRDSMITGISKENKQITVTMELIVSFIDYIEENGNAVRGNKKSPITQHYNLTFVLTDEKIDKCPNCGAHLTDNNSQKCEYCGSIISMTTNKATLSKKESLRQK